MYSTDPNFNVEVDSHQDETNHVAPAQQKIKVRLETKHRAGKTVTLIEGFVGNESEREELVKKLKNFCGTGGSAKDNEMLIQGNQKEKVIHWLHKNGYSQAKMI